MDTHRKTALLACMAVACMILSNIWSCSSSQSVQSRIQQDFKGIFTSEIRNLAQGGPGQGSGKITFLDAFRLAAKRDDRTRSSRISYEKSLVDITQAESIKWPRLFADVFFEVPIKTRDDEGGSSFTGGLVLKYNLLSAAFSPDAVSVETVKSQRTLLQEATALKDVYYGLLSQLAELELRQQELSILSSAMKNATMGLERAVVLSKLNYRSLNEMRVWEMDLRKLQVKHQEALLGLSTLKAALKIRLGLDIQQEPSVADLDRYLPQEADYQSYNPEMQSLLTAAYEQRNDVKIAEMELFLAEMAVVDAKRKRLPDLSLSLGLGNMLLRTREGTAPFVPFLGMSLPLFDMGDISRNIRKAELNSNAVKENIEALARRLSGDTQRAASQVRFAFESMQGLRKILETEKGRAETVKQLVQLRRADPLDEYRARMIADEMAVDYCQSVWAFRKAAIHLKETIGDPIIPL